MLSDYKSTFCKVCTINFMKFSITNNRIRPLCVCVFTTSNTISFKCKLYNKTHDIYKLLILLYQENT